MRGYRIRHSDGKWFFEFIPCNNNNQPIGKSCLYDNKEACLHGIVRLRQFISANAISNIDAREVLLERVNSKFRFSYIDGETKLYESRLYEQKANCVKSATMIFKYLSEYTTHEHI